MPRHRHPASPRVDARIIRRAVRSGLRRYPAEIVASLRAKERAWGHGSSGGQVEAIARAEFGAVWLGHASVLFRIGERLVAVDPVLSERIGLRLGRRNVGPARLVPPPVVPHEMPPLDLVIITHAHFDHLDRRTLDALASPRTDVITARRTAPLIPRGFGRVIELSPGQSAAVAGLRIDALRPRHWGARRWIDRRRGVNSYVVAAPDGRRLLLAGDTAFTNAFDRLESIDVATFGIGAYDPWEHMHATPEQVWQMFRAVGADRLLPIHHSTFELSDEPIHEPMERLLTAARDDRARVIRAEPGEVWTPNGVATGPG